MASLRWDLPGLRCLVGRSSESEKLARLILVWFAPAGLSFELGVGTAGSCSSINILLGSCISLTAIRSLAIYPEPCGYSSMSLCFSRAIAPVPCGSNSPSRFTFQLPQLVLALAPQHPQLNLLLLSFDNSDSLFRSCVSAARLYPAPLFSRSQQFSFSLSFSRVASVLSQASVAAFSFSDMWRVPEGQSTASATFGDYTSAEAAFTCACSATASAWR